MHMHSASVKLIVPDRVNMDLDTHDHIAIL